ncbi:MAG: flagellin N-terminal helical domain-containing protein [Pseudolabrys sp.]
MADIVLSAGVRQNLLSLQNTAQLMATTQNRLATGKKVNSALDNPTNFFTSASLQTRAGDLSALLDSMSNGIKTLEAADNSLTSITKTLETMQSTLRQARQDKSFPTASYGVTTNSTGAITTAGSLTFSGGAFGAGNYSITLTEPGTGGSAAVPATATGTGGFAAGAGTDEVGTGGTLTINGRAMTINATDKVADVINTINANTAFTGVTAGVSGGQLTLTGNAQGDTIKVDGAAGILSGIGVDTAGTGTTTSRAIAGTPAVAPAGARNTLDQLVAAINNDSNLKDKVVASNDSGKLRIQNLSTQQLKVDGVDSSGKIDGTSTAQATIGGNETRTSLTQQFNQLRDQLDKFSDDAYFNGVNLLRGDKLKLTFNETGSSALDIQARDKDGNSVSINNAYLQIASLVPTDLDSDASIDTQINTLGKALEAIRSQASNFGSNLSIVQNRQDFTKQMINTLQPGADNLVLADSNEEGANLLALQTRQQLSTTALSLSAQADQAVLRLFG